jgi:hypothetical protein
MRIHGRQGRPDAVRRTLRLLENRYADLGEAEISEATREVAHRQLVPRQLRKWSRKERTTTHHEGGKQA